MLTGGVNFPTRVLLLLALSLHSLGAEEPRHVAVVNGEGIPERIVQAFLLNDQEALQIDPRSEDGKKQLAELRQNIINEQIERMLIAQEARRRKIEANENDIAKAEHNAILGMNTEEAYAEFLRMNHFTREDYRKYVLASALNGKAMAAAARKEISVSDAKVRDYFEAHKNDPGMQWPERVEGAHILIGAVPNILREDLRLRKQMSDGLEMEKALADELARREKLANEVHDEAARPGSDFAALAKKYSEDVGTRDNGGSFGTFANGTHVSTLDDAFFKLKPGEVGPLTKTEYGFHIIKAIDHKPAGSKTLAEATPGIRAELEQAAVAKKLRDWLTQARASAKIEISGKNSETDPNRQN